MAGLLDLIAARNPEQAGGLLSDLVAAPRNRLMGLLDNPAGFMNSALREALGADQLDKAYGWRMNNLDAVTGSQDTRASVENDLAQANLNNALAALTVYHGSPHKFDKFDSSKIGAGEGAQAYGHGLYFAENPKVAQSYMDVDPSVIPDIRRSILGKEVQPGTWEYKAASLVDEMPLAKAKKMVQGWIDNARPGEDVRGYQQTLSTLNQVASKSDFKRLKPQSNLYKVDLPDDAIAKMLDWDKPLSQQTSEVKSALGKIASMSTDETVKRVLTDPRSYGESIHKALTWLGDNTALRDDRIHAAELLRANGIHGIRYLDQASRGVGNGTSNFVVFDDTLPTILERNGQKLK